MGVSGVVIYFWLGLSLGADLHSGGIGHQSIFPDLNLLETKIERLLNAKGVERMMKNPAILADVDRAIDNAIQEIRDTSQKVLATHGVEPPQFKALVAIISNWKTNRDFPNRALVQASVTKIHEVLFGTAAPTEEAIDGFLRESVMEFYTGIDSLDELLTQIKNRQDNGKLHPHVGTGSEWFKPAVEQARREIAQIVANPPVGINPGPLQMILRVTAVWESGTALLETQNVLASAQNFRASIFGARAPTEQEKADLRKRFKHEIEISAPPPPRALGSDPRLRPKPPSDPVVAQPIPVPPTTPKGPVTWRNTLFDEKLTEVGAADRARILSQHPLLASLFVEPHEGTPFRMPRLISRGVGGAIEVHGFLNPVPIRHGTTSWEVPFIVRLTPGSANAQLELAAYPSGGSPEFTEWESVSRRLGAWIDQFIQSKRGFEPNRFAAFEALPPALDGPPVAYRFRTQFAVLRAIGGGTASSDVQVILNHLRWIAPTGLYFPDIRDPGDLSFLARSATTEAAKCMAKAWNR